MMTTTGTSRWAPGGDLAADLERWLSEELGEPVMIEGLQRTSAGFSRENWVFDALSDGRRLPLIARRDPVGSVLTSDRAVEFGVLRHVEQTPVPSPVARWVDPTGTRLGRPSLIMDLARGRCDYHVLNGPKPLEARLALAQRIYDVLADIHRIDTAGLALEDPGPRAPLVALEEWERQLRLVQLEPEPELTFVIDWLRRHALASERTVLVHGDFKPGNLLLEGDTVSAVLDWETAHLGDPHEDLGWVTNPLRQAEHRIPGAFEPADLLARWSSRTGWVADPNRVRWWQILANLKLAVIVLSGVRAFSEARFDRLHQSPVAIYRLLLDQIGC